MLTLAGPPPPHGRRVPDELKKHYLSDGETGQYSTNLDRNRYGNDDQYLFTGAACAPPPPSHPAAAASRPAGRPRAGLAAPGPPAAASLAAARLHSPLAHIPRPHTPARPPHPAPRLARSGAVRPGVPGPVPLHGGRGDHRRQERQPVHLRVGRPRGLHLPQGAARGARRGSSSAQQQQAAAGARLAAPAAPGRLCRRGAAPRRPAACAPAPAGGRLGAGGPHPLCHRAPHPHGAAAHHHQAAHQRRRAGEPQALGVRL